MFFHPKYEAIKHSNVQKTTGKKKWRGLLQISFFMHCTNSNQYFIIVRERERREKIKGERGGREREEGGKLWEARA